MTDEVDSARQNSGSDLNTGETKAAAGKPNGRRRPLRFLAQSCQNPQTMAIKTPQASSDAAITV